MWAIIVGAVVLIGAGLGFRKWRGRRKPKSNNETYPFF
jgi:hypothetical protein